MPELNNLWDGPPGHLNTSIESVPNSLVMKKGDSRSPHVQSGGSYHTCWEIHILLWWQHFINWNQKGCAGQVLSQELSLTFWRVVHADKVSSTLPKAKLQVEMSGTHAPSSSLSRAVKQVQRTSLHSIPTALPWPQKQAPGIKSNPLTALSNAAGKTQRFSSAVVPLQPYEISKHQKLNISKLFFPFFKFCWSHHFALG